MMSSIIPILIISFDLSFKKVFLIFDGKIIRIKPSVIIKIVIIVRIVFIINY